MKGTLRAFALGFLLGGGAAPPGGVAAPPAAARGGARAALRARRTPGKRGGPVLLEVTVTAYSSTPDQTDATPFVTASGRRVRPGIVAVSRDLEARGLTFGTRLVITDVGGPGCGAVAWELVGKTLEVDDRMHRRKRRQLDVWMPSRAKALRFGRCRARVVALVEPGGGA